MMESVRRAGASLRVSGLDFRLTETSRERILWVSALPALAVCAMLTDLSLNLYFGQSGTPFEGLPPEGWQRVQYASVAITNLVPFIALPVMFAAGISRWSRAEGSWMLALGATLAIAAMVAGAATIAIYAIELNVLKQIDFRVRIWTRWTEAFALLAAGYFFVASRGLGASQRERTPMRRPEPAEGPE